MSACLSRRECLQGGVAALAASGIAGAGAAAQSGTVEHALVAAERPMVIRRRAARRTAAWTYGDDAITPVLRARQGAPLRLALRNDLDAPTGLCLHGVSSPDAPDGVPALGAAPLAPGDRAVFAFTPEIAGCYPFYSAYDPYTQRQRGLNGVLLVEEDDPLDFDADVVLVLQRFLIRRDGEILLRGTNPRRERNAGQRSVFVVDGSTRAKTVDVPTGGLVRVRVVNMDTADWYTPTIDGAASMRLIGRNGHILRAPKAYEPQPIPPLGRLDLLIRCSDREGALTEMRDAGQKPRGRILRLITTGAPARRSALPISPPRFGLSIGVPGSETIRITLRRAHGSGVDITTGLTTPTEAAWSINDRPLAADPVLPPPLDTMVSGRSYQLVFDNRTDLPQALTLHGHRLRLLGSTTRREILPDETVDIVDLAPGEVLRTTTVARRGAWLLASVDAIRRVQGMAGWFEVGIS